MKTGRITRASVEEYAKDKGYEPIQVDGIPEGFAFVSPDLTIGGSLIEGEVIVFKPMAMWGDEGTIIKSKKTLVYV